MNTRSNEIQNLLERLCGGVSVRDLTEKDIDLVRQIQEDGEFIVLSSFEPETEEKIESAVPFCFELKLAESGRVAVEIQPDGSARDGSFILDGNIFLTILDLSRKRKCFECREAATQTVETGSAELALCAPHADGHRGAAAWGRVVDEIRDAEAVGNFALADRLDREQMEMIKNADRSGEFPEILDGEEYHWTDRYADETGEDFSY